MPIRVLLADDNVLFLEGMASLLGREPSIQVVGCAKNAAEAVRKAAVLRPDVILMDIAMPLGGGIGATKQILEERPDQVVCMLTVSEQESDLYAAIRAGARGYLVKTMALDDLYRGLRVLAEGGAVITPRLAARLLREFTKFPSEPTGDTGEADKLTFREREVLEWVARGASNKEIGRRIGIAENTVKVHLRNIMDKLSLRNRQQAAAFAVQEGLVAEVRNHAAETLIT